MKINELVKKSQSRKPSNEESEVGLIQFREDDDIDPELRELSEVIITAETPGQARAILSIYFPELDWGGRKV